MTCGGGAQDQSVLEWTTHHSGHLNDSACLVSVKCVRMVVHSVQFEIKGILLLKIA